MFIYLRTIFLRETDATGILYFSELSKLALEAFEAYFLSKGFTLQRMIDQEDFLMPIVHSECDFSSPLRVGDEVKIELSLSEVGNSSFTVQTNFYHTTTGVEAGSAKIVHVAVDKKTGKSIPVPELILSHFCELRM